MSRYRYDAAKGRMLVLDESTGKWKPERKKKGKDIVCAPSVMSDIKEFISHATDKPVLIGSRSKLKAYERSNGIRQCGDFKKGEIISSERKRIQRSHDEARKLGGGASLSWV